MFIEHDCLQRGAALAFYALFSIPPLILFAVMMAGVLFSQETAERKVHVLLVEYVGKDNANLISSVLQRSAETSSQGWISSLAFLISVVVALQIFLSIRSGFRVIWQLEKSGESSILRTIVDHALSILMVLCTGFLLLISLVVTLFISLLMKHTEITLPFFWSLLNVSCSFLYLVLIFICVYWVLAGNSISFGYVTYGAVICTIMFMVGKVALTWYLEAVATATVYGAANVLVGFLIWIYYSSQLVFFGAELIQARRTRKEWMTNPVP